MNRLIDDNQWDHFDRLTTPAQDDDALYGAYIDAYSAEEYQKTKY